MSHEIKNLRNIGIIAHIDAGKTTVSERMLFYSGFTHRLGDVDRGNTVMDFDHLEQEHGVTIQAACITLPWHDITINLIDTPGHVDFTAEVERSLRVLDGGVVVFSAREGVEAQSETVWRQADKYRVPRIAFINKMDREGADFFRTLDEIRQRLNCKPIPLNLPVGAGPPHIAGGFSAVYDLIEMEKLSFTDKGEVVRGGEVPVSVTEDAELWHHQMLDQLSAFSDEMTERMLADEPVRSRIQPERPVFRPPGLLLTVGTHGGSPAERRNHRDVPKGSRSRPTTRSFQMNPQPEERRLPGHRDRSR